MAPQRFQLREVVKVEDGKPHPPASDPVTLEEPLGLRIQSHPLAVIMRTPGDDADLALGFLLSEGIIVKASEVIRIAPPEDAKPAELENILEVHLADNTAFDKTKFERSFYASSSCGLCGKASIEAIQSMAPRITERWEVDAATVLRLPVRLRAAQRVFAQTGSLHAAGLFDLEGTLLHSAEDIGRHNAVDKVIGAAARKGDLPLARTMLGVSGRISFEITQKAAMAGIPLLAAVSGASTLAVDLAEELGMTLAGFVRGETMTVYAGGWRLRELAPPK